MIIKKKTWPEYFQKIIDGKKNMELRLADFPASEGDTLVLEEYDPNTKSYTGRKIEKKIKNLIKWNPTLAHSMEDIKEFGFYEIEME
jgi:hypothetical protein